MADRSLSDIAEKMRDIDFAMFSTRAADGSIAARPMSNNRDVDYDGDSWFFTFEQAHSVADIERDSKVGLGFQSRAGIIGQRPFFISVEGDAELIRDKAAFKAHWTKDLDRWFEQGVDTPGIVLIRVRATRAHYWDGMDEGEVLLRGRVVA